LCTGRREFDVTAHLTVTRILKPIGGTLECFLSPPDRARRRPSNRKARSGRHRSLGLAAGL